SYRASASGSGSERVAEVVDRRRAAFGFQAGQLTHRLVLFTAGGTLLEVLPEERQLLLLDGAGDLEIDVLGQDVEALRAGQLALLRPDGQPQQPFEPVSTHRSLLTIGSTVVRDLTPVSRRDRASPRHRSRAREGG